MTLALILSICLIIVAIQQRKAKYFLIAGILSVILVLVHAVRLPMVNLAIPDIVLSIIYNVSILLLALSLFFAARKEDKNAVHSN